MPSAEDFIVVLSVPIRPTVDSLSFESIPPVETVLWRIELLRCDVCGRRIRDIGNSNVKRVPLPSPALKDMMYRKNTL